MSGDNFATTIVSLVNADSIVLAMDSAVVGTDPDTGLPKTVKACKMRCSSNACIAASGRLNSDGTAYDVLGIADRVLKYAGPVEGIATRMQESLGPLLPAVVQNARSATPKAYGIWVAGNPVLSLTIAAVKGEASPHAVSLEYNIDKSGVLLPARQTAYLGRAGRVTGPISGYNAAIKDFFRNHPEWSRTAVDDPVGTAVNLVGLEIKASDNARRFDVQGPIIVVVLDKHGFHIVPGREGSCIQVE